MNPILKRILLCPIALLSWTIQLCVFSFIACTVGLFVFVLATVGGLLIDNEFFDKELVFIFLIGWWGYYPWLWWYRYFKSGRLQILEEFI